MIPADFLAAERGIVELLKQATQTAPTAWCRKVSGLAELADVQELQQTTPALYVVYGGFAVLGDSNEFSAALRHRWIVVLAIASAAASRDTAALHAAAGPNLSSVLSALLGKTPKGAQQPLVLGNGPAPWHSEAKFSYFPLVFTTDAALCAAHT